MDYIRIGNKKLKVNGYKIINGKKVPIVKCDAKTIEKDGKKSVIISAPTIKVKGGQNK